MTSAKWGSGRGRAYLYYGGPDVDTEADMLSTGKEEGIVESRHSAERRAGDLSRPLARGTCRESRSDSPDRSIRGCRWNDPRLY